MQCDLFSYYLVGVSSIQYTIMTKKIPFSAQKALVSEIQLVREGRRDAKTDDREKKFDRILRCKVVLQTAGKPISFSPQPAQPSEDLCLKCVLATALSYPHVALTEHIDNIRQDPTLQQRGFSIHLSRGRPFQHCQSTPQGCQR